MKKESKIALIALPLGFGIFWLLNRYVLVKPSREERHAQKKKPSDDDLQTAVSAYEEALVNQESPATLHELNDSFAEQFNIQVHERQSDGVLVVSDMAGNSVATYNPMGTAMPEQSPNTLNT